MSASAPVSTAQLVDVLPGVLVALDLQGIRLRLDNGTVRARPVEKIDADAAEVIRNAKPLLVEHLALSPEAQRDFLLFSYGLVLETLGREVQRLYAADGRHSVPALQAERGWKVALSRYEALCLEAR